MVALSGLGRTLPDGHQHEVRWSPGDLERQLRIIREEARQAGRNPVLEALVQVVEVTGDRETALQDLASQTPGALAADLARTPFLLIGTHEEMAAQLLRQAGELGITSYAVREPAVSALERVPTLTRQPSPVRPSPE